MSVRPIPEFPLFEEISIDHLSSVKSISGKFPNYSDFNPVSLWSWSAAGPYALSLLNGNLVVRFADYVTGEQFLSFIGDSEPSATAYRLLDMAEESHHLEKQLRLIPECVAEELSDEFKIEVDRDSADYLFDPSLLQGLSGRSFRNLRWKSNRFYREHPEVSFLDLDSQMPLGIGAEITRVYELWRSSGRDGADFMGSDGELRAMLRLASQFRRVNEICPLQATLAFAGSQLVGVSIWEISEKDAVGHFLKADPAFGDLTKVLMLRCLNSVGLQNAGMIFNAEQDLGISGLRESKTEFAPVGFLNKFTVSRLHD